MLRQGDILFVPIPALPGGVTQEATPYEDRWIIARGEKTGHVHQIKSRAAEVMQGGSGRFLVAKAPVTVSHEEHAPIEIPAGTYQIIQQREQQADRPAYVQD